MLKLAFFSPLTPQHSGIADYSEELLPYLAARAEIDLFVDGFKPANDTIVSRFRLFDYAHDPSVIDGLSQYDAVIYHMGNDHRYHTGIYRTARRYPGIVVLHDFSLQHFFHGLARTEKDGVEIYLDELEASSGYFERQIAEEFFGRNEIPPHSAEPLRYPLNFQLATQSEAIIVHSEWSRERLLKIAPATPVRRIPHQVSPHPGEPIFTNPRKNISGPVRIASFGFINPEKGLERTLRALSRLRNRFDFQYTLVGEKNRNFDVAAVIRELGLEDRVKITGFVSIGEFVDHINETDIAINLRERTVGETSGSLCRIMNAGVAAMVSNEGWFSELPDDSVVKIDMQSCTDELLEAYLEHLISDPSLRSSIGANARRHVSENNSIENCAKRYLEFIEEIVAERPRRRFIQNVAADVAALGLTDSICRTFMPDLAREVSAFVSNGWQKDKIVENTEPSKKQDAHLQDKAEINCESVHIQDSSDAVPEPVSITTKHENGRLSRIEGVDYVAGALEYARRITDERRHHLYTKPFYNLANKPEKYEGLGLDADAHRHFCDFANMAVMLALPPGSRLLDVGCGSGWLSEYFARFGYEVTGVDISHDLIEMARERLSKVPYGSDHVTPLVWRFETLNVERDALDEEFDAVICYDSLHHFVDERSTMKNLARMTKRGGMLFILEGDKPAEDSVSADELRSVMKEFETLESPFNPHYLRTLLDEYGFAIVGDYVSVNGLFARDSLEPENRLPIQVEPINYLLCKKVSIDSPSSSVPDSRSPKVLAAKIFLLDEEGLNPETDLSSGALFLRAPAGTDLHIPLEIENSGDTLWLIFREAQRGAVMVGVRVYDSNGDLVSEIHGSPPMPGVAFAPGEKTRISIKHPAPAKPGKYVLKIDLVCQEICWFEERNETTPLTLNVEVF